MYPHLSQFLRDLCSYLPITISSVVLSVLYVFCSLRIPVLIGDAIDALLLQSDHKDPAFHMLLISIVLFAALSGLLLYFSSFLTNKLALKISYDLRCRSFCHLQSLPFSYLDRIPSGELLDTVITDIQIVTDGLQLAFSQLIIGVATLIGISYQMLKLDASALIVVLVLTPFSLLLTKFLAKNTHRYYVAQSEARTTESAFIDEMLSLSKINKAYSHEAEARTVFEELNRNYVSESEKATFFSSLTNPSTRLLNNVIYALIALLGSLLCITTGSSFTVGQFTSLLSFATQFGKPFNDISSVIAELQNAFNSIERVYSFLEAEEEKSDKADALNEYVSDGNVSVSDISFSYSKDKPFMQGLSFDVKKGEHVAIVGPTGCGKTTLINLLMRFYELDDGHISLDGTDILSLTRNALRSNYGMVLQDTWIKTATIRDNLSFLDPDADLNKIRDIARKTHADDFIVRMPQGYDTLIGEGGVTLSEGQRQLLCITRLFLSMPSVILMDEATSSIDTKTEQDIYISLNELLAGRTSFTVAHRLSTIINADLILVMRDGTIVESGTHADLLRQGGFYHDLYNSQYSAFS